jgi:protein O-mannosyl-transferase
VTVRDRRAARPRLLLAVAALCAAAVLPYLSALPGGFVFDDQSIVAKHPAVTGPFSLSHVLSARLLAGQPQALWRPLTTLSYALDWRIGSGSPLWFHVVNILLHAANTLLLAWIVRRLFRSETLALVAGLLFAVHPIHTEAVSWIAGRADLLAAFFGLLAIGVSLERHVRWLALPALFLAVSAKESAAVFPLLILFTSWWVRTRVGGSDRGRALRAGHPLPADSDPPPLSFALLSFLPVVLYFAIRRAVMGTWAGPVPDPLDNPMAGTSLFQRLPTILEIAGRSALLLIWPARLSVDYSVPVIRLTNHVTALMLPGATVTGGLVFLALRRRGDPSGWGAGFALLSFALVSNIAVLIVTVFAERFLYLPSAGLVVIAAEAGLALSRPTAAPGLPAASRVPATTLWAALGILLIAAAGRTWIRSRDYRDDISLYAASMRATPNSLKLRTNLAANLLWAGRYQEAYGQAIEALRLDPSQRPVREVVACALDSLGRREAALVFLNGVVANDPMDRASRRRLIQMLQLSKRQSEADSIAESGMREDPTEVEWIVRSARGAQNRGDLTRAAVLWEEAATRSPSDADAPLNLAYCRLASGDANRARDAYAEALRRAPESPVAANGLAWTLLETGGPAVEAVRRAEQASAASAQAPYFDTLARAYLAVGRCDDARRAIARALKAEPDNPDFRLRESEVRARCGQ